MTSDASRLPAVRRSDQDRLAAAEQLLREWYAWWEGPDRPPNMPQALYVRTAVYLQMVDILAPEAEQLTVTQAADRLRVDRRTVNRWIHAGRLPAIQVGDAFRVRACDVDALVRRVTTQPGSDSTQPR